MSGYRYGEYHDGPDPLAAPFDARGALDELGDAVLDGADPSSALRDLLRRGVNGRRGLDDLLRRVRDRQREIRDRGRLDGILEEARALLDTAAAWLRGRGLEAMRGPMNPSTNYECGLLVDGFEHHPPIMTTWNPQYYASLLEDDGFTKAQDLLGWWVPAQENEYRLPPVYGRVAERARPAAAAISRTASNQSPASSATSARSSNRAA